MKLLSYLGKLWHRWRDRRANEKRRKLKRQVLLEDMRRFCAGRETAQESRQYRDEAYAVIDSMGTDEILKL